MLQRANGMPSDPCSAHVEEFDLRQRAAVEFFQQFYRVGPLNLISEGLPDLRVGNRSLITIYFDVVSPRLRIELHPIGYGGSTHQTHLVVLQAEQDHVANDVAVVVTRDELLRLIASEAVKRVDTEVRDEAHHVRSLKVQVRHMKRLIHQRHGFTPCPLLIAPIRKLSRYWIHVQSDLRVPQHLNRTTHVI